MNDLSHAARVAPETLHAIADEVGTPAYIYDLRALEAGIRRWIEAVGDPARISFAAKANTNLAVLAALEESGVGIEVATPGELARARAAGFPESRIVFGGVPKSEAAVREGIEAGVGMVVLQSGQEVEAAIRYAGSCPHGPLVAGLRVRPGIRAGAHPSLETGRADAKFGFAPERIPELWARVVAADGIEPRTLAFHLGSGLEAVEPYEQAVELMLSLVDALADTSSPVAELDVGGGLGVDYGSDRDPDPAMLVEALEARIRGIPIDLRFEPGRSVVARAGVLLTRVLYRRERMGRPALVCDAGYTDFARNALYGAEHAIVPVDGELLGEPIVEVLGPTCESGDVLGTNRRLQAVEPGDLLLLRDAGAYGFVMASNYNSRPRPPELLVDGAEWQVVRPRERIEDLWRGELIP
jgi:diaminopimelate decarboxylase